jgi:hypothetical protein
MGSVKDACARCGVEGHHSSACKKPHKVDFVHCKRLGFKEVGHWVGWRGCPALDIMNKRVVKGTRYTLRGWYCVVVELLLPGRERVYVASLYCQFSEDIERFLDMIGRIHHKLKGSRIILGMDSNAHSQLWRGETTDVRGTHLECIILDGLKDSWVQVYMDNPIVLSQTLEVHRHHLGKVVP